MAGIMVSVSTGVMNSLLAKLTMLLGEKYKHLKGVKCDITFLRDELSSMNALLEKLANMEALDPLMKVWRDQVREMAYDIEDCIDEYMYQLEHEPDRPDGIKGFFHKIIRKIENLLTRDEIAEQIQELKGSIAEVSHRRKRYKLDVAISSSSSSTGVVPIDPRMPALYVEAAGLVGIDDPRDEIVKLVTDEDRQLKVVSIVGFGGLGKTTLANQVYEKVKGQFNCWAFVSVSQKPDMKKIFRNIFSQINHASCTEVKAWDEEQLISKMREFLEDKRYFIVVDDIWSVLVWETIKCGLLDSHCGSRIVITTRIISIAKSCCSPRDFIYNLKPLNEVDSESLFFGRIFGSKDGCPPHLKEISTEIMKKCGGLPLAIITMSSLLSNKSYTREEWESIRNSIDLGLEKNYDVEKMRMILSLSYNDLPRHLKTCLLYISIFPEDYKIRRACLLRRWIAEGFIEIVRGRTLEEEAKCYFNELINRSMIQPIDIDLSGQANACRIHDMILDLITCLATEENFVTFIDNKDHKLVSKDKTRRLSLEYHGKKCTMELPMAISQVRSLSIFGGYSEQMTFLSDFRALRVIDMESSNELENHHLQNIGKLVQLRYLRLVSWKITELSEQIGELQFLETLDLACTCISDLPASIIGLRRLKHLLVNDVKLPDGIGNMHALEELSRLYVDESCTMICLMELSNLTKLRALTLSLRIRGSKNDKIRYADNLVLSLSKLGSYNLRSLIFDGVSEISLDSWSAPPRLLRRLSIYGGYFLCKIPEWISSLANLTDLCINVNIVRQESFEILGDLPALTCLCLISKAAAPEGLIVVGSGRFRWLKVLNLGCLFGFVMKFEAGAMPKLEDLHLSTVKTHGAMFACGNAPDLGIHHLSALKLLVLMIDCRDARTEEVVALEAAISNTASYLPNHPTLYLVRWYEKQMAKDDEEMKSLEGDEEPIADAS